MTPSGWGRVNTYRPQWSGTGMAMLPTELSRHVGSDHQVAAARGGQTDRGVELVGPDSGGVDHAARLEAELVAPDAVEQSGADRPVISCAETRVRMLAP